MKNILIWIGRILLLLFLILLFSQFFYTGTKKLGNNITYYDENKVIFGKVDVPPTILSYDYDKQFIIVKQKPRKYPNATKSDRGIYPSGRDTIYYWLIIKAEEKVLGPLDFEEFKELKTKYGVSNELVLE